MEKFRLAFGLILWAILLIFPPKEFLKGREGFSELPQASESPAASFINNLEPPALRSQAEVEKENSPVTVPLRIEIPRIELDTPIEVVGYAANKKWLVPKSLPATPKKELNIGGGKNVSIWGHRKGIFNRLGELEAGDEIIVFDSFGGHFYRVFEKKIVEPKDGWVMNHTSDFQLTLITCEPWGSEKNRLVIFAKLI